jgi:hypothetical protein
LADQAVAKEMQKLGAAVPRQLASIEAEDPFDLAWKFHVKQPANASSWASAFRNALRL